MLTHIAAAQFPALDGKTLGAESKTTVGQGLPAMLTIIVNNENEVVRTYAPGSSLKVPHSFEGMRGRVLRVAIRVQQEEQT